MQKLDRHKGLLVNIGHRLRISQEADDECTQFSQNELSTLPNSLGNLTSEIPNTVGYLNALINAVADRLYKVAAEMVEDKDLW